MPSLIFSQNSAPPLTIGNLIFSASANYVSSATIKQSPFSPDIIERNSLIDIKGGYGYSFTVKTRLFRNDLFFGITGEYIKIQDDDATQTLENDTSAVRIRVSETLTVTPIEFTGYFNVPSFQENLNIYLGGGIGLYMGDRVRKIQNFESETISKSLGLSLVVLSGIEYYFEKNAMAFFEMRFREGEYDVKSKFPVGTITVRGTPYNIGREMNSKIFLDGLRLSVGLGYRF